jgi:hypothetical protein
VLTCRGRRWCAPSAPVPDSPRPAGGPATGTTPRPVRSARSGPTTGNCRDPASRRTCMRPAIGPKSAWPVRLILEQEDCLAADRRHMAVRWAYTDPGSGRGPDKAGRSPGLRGRRPLTSQTWLVIPSGRLPGPLPGAAAPAPHSLPAAHPADPTTAGRTHSLPRPAPAVPGAVRKPATARRARRTAREAPPVRGKPARDPAGPVLRKTASPDLSAGTFRCLSGTAADRQPPAAAHPVSLMF